MTERKPRQITFDEWLRQFNAQTPQYDTSKTSDQQTPSDGNQTEKEWRTRQDSNL